MWEKVKEHWDVVLSAVISIAGVIATIIAAFWLDKQNHFVVYIVVLAIESLLAFLLVEHIKCKLQFVKEKERLETEVLEKKNKIQGLESELKKKTADYLEELAENESNFAEAFRVVFTRMKEISKLNNDFCTQIPHLTEKAYKVVERIQQKGVEPKESDYQEIAESIDELSEGLFLLYKRYTTNMLRSLTELFEGYLNRVGIVKRVSATVKLFDKPFYSSKDRPIDFRVYTAFRDNYTYRECPEREIGKQAYTINGNSDFQICLTHEDYYINNAKRGDGTYKNEHTDFDSHYNCACVVPIKVKLPDGSYKVMGYLCCDCLNDTERDVFNVGLARILFSVSQTYGTFLETLHSNWLDRVDGEGEIPQSFLEVIYNYSWKG